MVLKNRCMIVITHNVNKNNHQMSSKDRSYKEKQGLYISYLLGLKVDCLCSWPFKCSPFPASDNTYQHAHMVAVRFFFFLPQVFKKQLTGTLSNAEVICLMAEKETKQKCNLLSICETILLFINKTVIFLLYSQYQKKI